MQPFLRIPIGQAAKTARAALGQARWAVLLALLACTTRPLTEAERDLLAPLHGPTLATERVAIVRTPGIDLFPITFDARPRTTCRERIGRPREGRITVRTAGIVLFDTFFAAPDFARSDYAAEMDGALDLPSAMFLAHEATHVWQWQNRDVTGYHPAKAFLEQATIDDPYLFDETTEARFLDFGYEVQASLVEEYLCCATLDSNGARTLRLHDLLRQVMPVAEPEAFPRRVTVPWGEDLPGICS